MANANRPFGMRPTRYLDASPFNGLAHLYHFSASSAVAAYVGDIVQIDTTNRATDITDIYAPGIPAVAAATSALTTNAYRGVVIGFVPTPEFNNTLSASLGTTYHVASTKQYCHVVDDYHVIVEAQELTANGWTSSSSNPINKNAELSYVAGSQITGISASGTTSTFTTSGVKPFRVLRLTQRPDNWLFTASDTNSYAHWDLQLANSDLAQATVGA